MEVTPVGATLPRNMPVNGAAILTAVPATGNAIYKDSLWCSYQLISGAAATVIIEGTNEQASATGVNNNWVPVTGTTSTSTITLAAAGSGGFIDATGAAWRWVRARVTAATTPTSVLMGV